MRFSQVGSGAYLPMEICNIVGGQIRNSQPPPELTKDVVEFATKKPAERLSDIRRSLTVCPLTLRCSLSLDIHACPADPRVWNIEVPESLRGNRR